MRGYTETSALREILEWSTQKPDWLRDALRRLMAGDELSDEDIDDLEAICLGVEVKASPLTDVYDWPRPWTPAKIAEWIHRAFVRRNGTSPNNSRKPFACNRMGDYRKGWQ